MIMWRVNILSVQETKWKGQKEKEVKDTGFKLWYTDTMTNKNGVGIMLNKSLKNGVVDIKRQGDMIILVKLLVMKIWFLMLLVFTPLK
jgi:exonuclease III